MQAVGSWVPPWQWAIGGGVSVSGYGTSRMPQAPLWVTALFITVSLRAAAMMIPEPMGDGVVSGVWELLLSCTSLRLKIVHESVPLGLLMPPGQAPFRGQGASSFFW